jgi:hypothetical protein
MVDLVAAASSSGLNLTALLSPIITVVIFLFGAIGVYLRNQTLKRREAKEKSGDIMTSDASTLWAQSQSMLSSSQEARFNAETQRDKLLDSQSNLVVPALVQVNAALQNIAIMLTAVMDKLDANGNGDNHAEQ